MAFMVTVSSLSVPDKVIEATDDIPQLPYKVVMAEVTMYNSDPAQTDDTPFVMASGKTVGDGYIACPPKYKFGTKVEIKGKIYECQDRMNKRYHDGEYFDIWTLQKSDALSFGRQQLSAKVYE